MCHVPGEKHGNSRRRRVLIQALISGSAQVRCKTESKAAFYLFVYSLSLTQASVMMRHLLCHISPSQTELSASVSHADLTPNCITLKNHRREQKSSVGLFSCYFRRRHSFTPATHT